MINAYGAYSADKPLEPITIERRDVGPHDVAIDIAYCGVCHSDLHTIRGEWADTQYPCVPGHEIVGRVSAVGRHVAQFKEGDLVGVGCMVDSCQHCASCDDGLEQYCETGNTLTYNSPTTDAPGYTLGGYAQRIVVKDKFVLSLKHHESQLAAVAPLLCAGVTMWSPLRHWQAGPGKRVGIVGIGGLGHVGIKLARALGAEVVAFTTSEGKREEAARLGAHSAVNSQNGQEMESLAGTFDLIVDTVAATHDLNPYVQLLRRDGALVLVGLPEEKHPAPDFSSLIFSRKSIAGSTIGSVRETQDMLDFCAEHGIVSHIELIRAELINEAFDRMVRGEVRYRFVIDIESLAA